jgi:hypothetical protein
LSQGQTPRPSFRDRPGQLKRQENKDKISIAGRKEEKGETENKIWRTMGKRNEERETRKEKEGNMRLAKK